MAVDPIKSSSDIRMDYMKLLVTQLQNQNPLEPMDNNQMASQLTQLGSLQQLESMNSSFQRVLHSQQSSQATTMIGKEILWKGDANQTLAAVVKGVKVTDETVLLDVGGYDVDLKEVLNVRNPGQNSGAIHNGEIGQTLLAEQFNQIAALIGREVTFAPPSDWAGQVQDPISEKVKSMEIVNNQVLLHTEHHTIGLADVISVK